MVALPVARSTKRSVSAGMSGLGMLITPRLLLLYNDTLHEKHYQILKRRLKPWIHIT